MVNFDLADLLEACPLRFRLHSTWVLCRIALFSRRSQGLVVLLPLPGALLGVISAAAMVRGRFRYLQHLLMVIQLLLTLANKYPWFLAMTGARISMK